MRASRASNLPQANFTPTFIYVIFWVGLVPLSILFGDVFRAFNPWRAIARGAGWLTSRVAGPLPTPFRYPDWLGRWPAAVGLFAFAWMELSYTNGSDPSTLAIAALVYTAITLVAIACFGTEAWISRGEAFSVYFNLFSRISPVERARRPPRAPPPAVRRSPGSKPSPGTIPLLCVMIGTVAFDGASEGKPWVDVAPDIQDFFTSTRVQSRHGARDHLHDRDADRRRTGGADLHARDRRRPDGRPARLWRDRALVHAHAGADRGRVRDRPLLLAAGLQRPVDHLPGLRPARAGDRTCSARRTRRSTTASSTRRRSGTYRWACWSSATYAG